MKIYLSTFVFMLICWSQTWAQFSDTVYAQIGKMRIDKSVFEEKYYQRQSDFSFKKLSRGQFMLEMIQDSILLLEARAKRVKVDDKEIEYRIMPCFPDSILPIDMQEQARKSRIAAKKFLTGVLQIQKLQKKIESEVKINRKEVKQYFQKLIQKPKDSVPILSDMAEVGLIRMGLQPSDSVKNTFKNEALKIKNRIKKEINYSPKEPLEHIVLDSANRIWYRTNLKEIDHFKIPDILVKNLKVGEISQPIEIRDGFMLIQMIDTPAKDYLIDCYILYYSDVFEKEDKARKQLLKVQNMIVNKKISFERAFRKFSENKSESIDKNGFLLVENERFISLDQINSYVYFTIDTMQVGQISLPTIYRDENNRYGFQLIYLKSKIKGGVPDIHNPAHYLKIKTWALAEKQEIEFKKWVQRKVKKYQVKLASEFQNCVNY